MKVEKTTYAIRLPVSAIDRLKRIAKAKYLPPTVLALSWLMERIEAEQMNENPAVGAELPGTAPTADAQHTPTGGMVANGIES